MSAKRLKLGPNNSCPCGSGQKYKNCHGRQRLDLPFLIQQARIEKHVFEEGKRLLDQQRAREIQRQQQQGLGRPIISVEHKGMRFVAVGGLLCYGKWKTFFDFLGDYIKQVLGSDWGNGELKKPFEERHPILKWYHHLCSLQREFIKVPGQVSSSPMTGAVSAYYRLAYNLYLIAHNGADIQTRLLSRLRNTDNFPGAFFETQAAAWMIKAGFELEFENESDMSRTHCEFTATYPPTKAKFSVEAKSRNPGVNNEGPKGLSVGRQLRRALEKQADHPRLVFVDLNIPLQSQQQANRVFDRAERVLKRFEDIKIAGQPAPPAYICLTNISDHYFLESANCPVAASFRGYNIQDFMGSQFSSLRAALRAREKHLEMFELWKSMEKHLHIPSTFDGELPSAAFSDGQTTRMIIGQTYLTPGPDGVEVPARLTTATVDNINGEMVLAFHDPRTEKSWISNAPMTPAELEDYKRYPDTFFGIHLEQGGRAESPIELFDFFYKTYRNTPKEKILEWMGTAEDFAQLKELSQKDLSETYCERLIYGIMAQQEAAKKNKTRDPSSPASNP